MAINFPNSPVNGSTYDYLGVRYTYTKDGANEGYWRVTTPGTVGIATSADISAGTDGVKYVTPEDLVGTAEWQLIQPTADTVAENALAFALMTGVVLPFAMSTAPNGWLKADGALVNRTTYARLFTAIGTTYGVGNGTTTFGIPDLRGEFVRGLDNGRGADEEAARTVGSSQDYQISNHQHDMTFLRDYDVAGSSRRISYQMDMGNGIAARLTDGVYDVVSNGVETRPRNVALLYCIRY